MSENTQEPNADSPENTISGADAAFLRVEVQKTQDKARQARLLGEAGEVAEREGDEPAAARDYLAAFNADPTFREPLEALVRLLERRRSLKNLGRVIDALVRAAITPSEKARALVMRAAYAEDVQGDVEVAKGSAQEALHAALEGEGETPVVEAATAALTLEMIAARLEDAGLREEALHERVKHTVDETWKALLRMDLARMAAARGETEKALSLFAEARGAGSEATFLAALASERLVKSDPGLPGSEEATQRSDAYADALEVQAALVGEALTDPARGKAFGVPHWAQHPAFLVDAYLRAADVRRLRGEVGRAASLLDRAIESVTTLTPQAPAPVPEQAPTEGAEGEVAKTEEAAPAPTEAPKPDPVLLDALLAARMRVSELLGDTANAASLAERRLEKETDGPTIAALAMRVAEQAASEGDAARALEAVSRAVKGDPGCVPARALQLDILADSGDAGGYAEQLEAFAESFATDDARARAFLLSAFVWAVRAGDVPSARAALTQAQLYGAPLPTGARVARMLAIVSGDVAWQDEADRRVIASGAEGSDLASLWFDLLRLRLAKGDADGVRKALGELISLPESAWLGRALEAFLPGVETDPANALRALAAHESDPEAARALEIVAALRAVQANDEGAARGVLRELVASKPSDLIAATFLADLEIRAGDTTAAAIAVEQAAGAIDDPVAAASLSIEAGLLRWRVGDKEAALEAFAKAQEQLAAREDRAAGRPNVAQTLLEWASRGVEPDTVEARRHAIERAAVAGNPPEPLGLERFAAELVGGDSAAAGEALSSVEASAQGDLAIAASLGRLLWPDGTSDRAAFGVAMDRLREAGSAALAASERYRAARDGEPDEAARAARDWFEAGGGAAAALEWLLCATRSGDVAAEVEAREALGRTLGGEAGEAVHAWAGQFRDLHGEKTIVGGSSDAARLARLEMAPAGSDPRRRAGALCTLGDTLGEETHIDAMAMGAWSLMLMGDVEGALQSFAAVAAAQPDDLAAWEGMRTAAESLDHKEAQARAAEELGARCGEATRGAAFWEEAAARWLELGHEEAGEAALEASFQRDPRRGTAFDTLFRRVRARKDGDKLLTLIAARLDNTDDPPEVAKLYWEQARVLREKGDSDGALNALENVTMIEPDHVGALALTGEVFIRRQMYAEAADRLSHLAALDQAPPKNRVTAGVASADLFENKLDQPRRAVEVLMMLHNAGLSTLPVRERLAKAAARTGSWQEAVVILEQLMNERKEPEGRVDAARLAMMIRRDKLGTKNLAAPSVVRVLEAIPGDGEALDLLLEIDAPNKMALLQKGRDATLAALQKSPLDVASARRLVRLATALSDASLEGPAAAVAAALGGSDASVDGALVRARARQGRALPQLALSPQLLRLLMAPGDDGPIAMLFTMLGPALAEALGPTLAAIAVGKRDKVDPRAGLQARSDIAAWAGAFGIVEFDLYVGGKDPLGIQGIPGEVPALVVGPNVKTPFDAPTASRVARELFAISRGTTSLRFRDETTVAAIVVAACRLAEVPINAPPYAMLAEVEKALKSALPRRTRKALPEVCTAIAQSGLDPKMFARAALASQARVAAVAGGEVMPVLIEISPPAQPSDPRAVELMKFVLTPAYADLRRGLGLEGGSR